MRAPLALLAALAALAACDVSSLFSRGAREEAPPGPAPAAVERGGLELPDHPGISGAALGSGGEIYLVAERRPSLLVLGGEDGSAQLSLPLTGLVGEVDLESLAILGEGRFALGTEAKADDRDADAVLLVDREGGSLRVRETLPLSYAPWGLKAPSNKGIEGLCAAGGALLAGVEATVEVGGRRIAPLALRAPDGGPWIPLDLALTTTTGKISALDCQLEGEGLRVYAVERHFGVCRILSFVVPLGAAPRAVIEPTVLVDLAAAGGELPNFEGLLRRPDGRLWLISDNDYGGASGPAVTWLVTPP